MILTSWQCGNQGDGALPKVSRSAPAASAPHSSAKVKALYFGQLHKLSSTEIPRMVTRSIFIHAYERKCHCDAGEGITILGDIVFFNVERYVEIWLYGGAEQMGVTKEQAVQNRERILAAAERLFGKKGSMRSVLRS
jgi:hypothetical protein